MNVYKVFVLLIIIKSNVIFALNVDQQSIQDILIKNNYELSKQSYCYEKNNLIIGLNINKSIRPASVTKWYLTYYALKKLGFSHKFKTEFILDEKNNLYIKGGNDPFFVSENMYELINKLNEKGISKLNNVYYDSNFQFNWRREDIKKKNSLRKFFNTKKFLKFNKKVFEYVLNNMEESSLDNDLNFPNISSLKIYSRIEVDSLIDHKKSKIKFRFIHQSDELYKFLKVMNNYSNNFIADSLYNFLGGEKNFNSFFKTNFKKEYERAKGKIYFYTGSGLGSNKTTCMLTLKLQKKLEEYLYQNDYSNSDLLAVVQKDEGTLRNRFENYSRINDSIWAKTGTLKGLSSLSGIVNTLFKSKHFAIFLENSNLKKSRNLQEEFVDYFFSDQSVMISIDYFYQKFSPLQDNDWRFF